MRRKKLSIGLRAALAMFAVALFATSALAATEKKLHNFGNGTDGANPYAGLIMDAVGNLYGTTYQGGDYGYGTVFELTANGSGGWTEKKLHNFRNGTDGAYPNAALIFDAVGNLYGTTYKGGEHSAGTVFELTPNGSGGWTEKKLHTFYRTRDGLFPAAGLIFDTTGNLYGTTSRGGDYDSDGTVFELTPNGSGVWTEKVLHSFGNRRDGAVPTADLIFDAAGNLYGTTRYGGDTMCGVLSCGAVFELTPEAGGGWRAKVLFNFNGRHGAGPSAALIFDAAGNLYGTASYGGDYGWGAVFELSPNGSGGWTENVLHNFGFLTDGSSPRAGLIMDAAGNLYSTTYGGGTRNVGTVFELSPRGDGGWTEKKLHNFGSRMDGYFPQAGVIFDAAGNLYGTTSSGGDHGVGTVFEITP